MTQTIHSQILDQLQLEVGDEVKITHEVPSYDLGWDNGWVDQLDSHIGKTGIVTDICHMMGVELDITGESGLRYPAQSLKVISRKQDKVKDLAYYKNNAEENYITTPISVLRYIAELEEALDKSYCKQEMEVITLSAVNLGMIISRDQLNGDCDKSGKGRHAEWFKKFKK